MPIKDQLDTATHKALEKIFDKWKYFLIVNNHFWGLFPLTTSKEKLLDCFPTLKQRCPDSLERAHDQIKDYVMTNVMRDYDALNTEKKMAELLEELDELKQADTQVIENSKRFDPAQEANPEQKSAKDLKRAASAPYKRAQLDQMRKLYQQEMEEVNRMNGELNEMMEKYTNFKLSASDILKLDIDGAAQMLENKMINL